jgi:tRNA pseudouridine55 synthase
VLLDKPPGRSSHRAVAELRAATGARTGHTGTLDPFASGLLVLLSGLATRLAPCFVGLDKRYRAEIDLGATTSTGDPEGELLERHPAPGRDELEARLAGLRGEVELRVPAASAVKLGGERAYRLARRGVAEWSGERATLELHVSSGTYVRSIAAALGGHCVALRRTAVGPFTLAEADPGRIVPAAAALARLPAAALARVPEAVRARVLAFEAGGGAA